MVENKTLKGEANRKTRQTRAGTHKHTHAHTHTSSMALRLGAGVVWSSPSACHHTQQFESFRDASSVNIYYPADYFWC